MQYREICTGRVINTALAATALSLSLLCGLYGGGGGGGFGKERIKNLWFYSILLCAGVAQSV